MCVWFAGCLLLAGMYVTSCVVVAPVHMNISGGSSTGTVNKKKDKGGKKGKKQPLTKSDIGVPTNFQFVAASLSTFCSSINQSA